MASRKSFRLRKFQSLNWDGVISNSMRDAIEDADWMFQSLNWDGVISN